MTMKFFIKGNLEGGVRLVLLLIQIYSVASATLENINTGPLYDVQVVLGNRAELPCEIQTRDITDRVLLVLWFKDGEGSSIYTYDSRRHGQTGSKDWSDKKTLGGRAHFDIKASPTALVIDDIRESDAGHYRCRVDFKKSPTRKARTNLTVIIPPNPPRIISENGITVDSTIGPLNEGSSLNLRCEVTGGNPSPRVTWWMGHKLLDASYESTPANDVFSNTLHLPKLGREHLHAVLICQASNSNYSTPVQTKTTIDMNFKPMSVRFLGSREPLSAGKHYELECQSIGAKPSAIITWWLGGVQLTNTTSKDTNSGNITLSRLYFTPQARNGNQLLTCKAESQYINHKPLTDEWQLQIYYAPVVHLTLGSSLRPDSIREGDDVYFECHVRAEPWLYKIIWYHNGILVIHKVSEGVIITNQSLVIQKVKREQTGLYTCVVSNLEGDGESNALGLKVLYAPVCAKDQTHVYGAARHEEVTVTCTLDAVPSKVSFSWRFNNSGDIVDIAESHVSTEGLESSLSYIARTELDYGTLLCWGVNKLGRQREPCIFKVVPAGAPDMPINCTVNNSSTTTLHVRCYPGYDGGLEQTFVSEVFNSQTNELRLNVSESLVPDFILSGLEAGTGFKIVLYAVNSKGQSKKRNIKGYTLKDVAERRTAPVRPPPEENIPITPLLAVAVGVAGSLLLVILVAVVILRLNKDKKKPKHKPKPITLPLHTPVIDTKEVDDINPDVIPNSGSDSEGKAPTTPEEGGFGSVHICASVPTYTETYTSNMYSTLPRNAGQSTSPSQPTDLMYAELAFPRSHYSNSGSLPRRKLDPTVYAKLDHISPSGQVEPLGTASYTSPAPSVSGSCSPPFRATHPYLSHINVPIPTLRESLGLRPNSRGPSTQYKMDSSGLQDGVSVTCLGSYNASNRTTIAYDGHIPPPALSEEDDHHNSTTVETPLMSEGNKESQV